MSKDPAFLFYSQDFIVGVQTLSFEDRGKYITILAQMHQEGRLSEETICFIVGSVSVSLKRKFSIDENGLWYNERLEFEALKRRKYNESRAANGKNGGRPKKLKEPYGLPYAKPYENHTENENNKVIESIDLNKVNNKSIKKEKKKKEKKLEIFPEEKSEAFLKFEAWILKDAPRVAKMEEPITQEQFNKLMLKYSKELIMEKVLAMQNRADLHKNNISAYLTLNNWSKKDIDKDIIKPETPIKLGAPNRAYQE